MGDTSGTEENQEDKMKFQRGNKSLKEALLTKSVKRVDFLTTGCIPLNLAISQKGRRGGIARGRIINFVGDGSSGKTLLSLEICAHAFYYVKKAISNLFPKVKKVNIVYDNIEGTMDLPLELMYGEEFVNGVEWIQSKTCEGFGKNFMKRAKNHKKGEFLLYVVDSIDALIPRSHQADIDKYLKSNDDEMKEGFGAEKAKYFSKTFFKTLCSLMKDKDITLICISQVRERIGIMFGEKYYRTGGKAMDFYTHLVLWLAEKKKLEKKGLIYGVLTKANVKRSKVSKPFRMIEFPIILDHGIDNVGSMIDFLYGDKEIVWKKKKYGREGFINLIENNSNEYDCLVDAVEKKWFDREKKSTPLRKKRFIV